jgi:hypothetical protein
VKALGSVFAAAAGGGFVLWYLSVEGDGLIGLVTKLVFVGICISLWYHTQALINTKGFPGRGIGDMIHLWTEGIHAKLLDQPSLCRQLLIWSSLGIDIFGLSLIAMAVFGSSISPFLALVVLFAMRQVSQMLCSLPAPDGMIWRDPRVPSLLVTYKTCNDFFFSGHTAIACLGSIFAWQYFPWWAALAVTLVAAAEAFVVLVLRAHYTMDVICAVLASIVSYSIAVRLCSIWGI